MDEYISKQRAKDSMGCCLAFVKAEYKAAKDEFTKARFGDYISAIQSMIDVVSSVEASDVWIRIDKRIEHLQRENKQLREDNQKLREALMRTTTDSYEFE